MSLLIVILGAVALYLGWRLLSTRRVIRDLTRAARDGEMFLLAERGSAIRWARLDKLVREVNRLVREKNFISGAGLAYHEQIQALLGNLRDGVAMVDRNNAIVSANPALREVAGTDRDPVGQRLDSLIQGTQFLEFIQQAHEEGQGQLTEMKVRINRSSRWLEVSAAPLEARSEGEGPFTLFIFHDITRQKGLEKMRSEFVANVSHELKTPVTIIKGFAETLLEDEMDLSPEERRRFLAKIGNNSDRLHRLLEDLLLLTRLESMEPVLHKETLQLNAFIHDIIENWHSAHAKDALHLETELEDPVSFEADPLRLGQVFSNLIDNARRHARGATQILISTRVEPAQVTISVQDDGAGIPEKDLPHIFQRFYRVEKGRSRESGGTGLGLSIVKHIVAQHGGEISAHSRVGEGTRIDVILPRNAEHPQASSTTAVSDS